jgi:hypothetical protein
VLIVLVVNHLLVLHGSLLVITGVFLAIGTFLGWVHPLLLLMLLLFLQHHVRLSTSAACGAWLLGLGVGFGGADLGSLLNSSIADHLVVVLHYNVLSCGLKFAGATSIALMVTKAGRLPRFSAGLSNSLHALFAIWLGDPVLRAHF